MQLFVGPQDRLRPVYSPQVLPLMKILGTLIGHSQLALSESQFDAIVDTPEFVSLLESSGCRRIPCVSLDLIYSLLLGGIYVGPTSLSRSHLEHTQADSYSYSNVIIVGYIHRSGETTTRTTH